RPRLALTRRRPDRGRPAPAGGGKLSPGAGAVRRTGRRATAGFREPQSPGRSPSGARSHTVRPAAGSRESPPRIRPRMGGVDGRAAPGDAPPDRARFQLPLARQLPRRRRAFGRGGEYFSTGRGPPGPTGRVARSDDRHLAALAGEIPVGESPGRARAAA